MMVCKVVAGYRPDEQSALATVQTRQPIALVCHSLLCPARLGHLPRQGRDSDANEGLAAVGFDSQVLDQWYGLECRQKIVGLNKRAAGNQGLRRNAGFSAQKQWTRARGDGPWS